MAEINSVTTLTQVDGIGVIVINSPPVNALSAAVREGVSTGVRMAEADPDVKAIVLRCDGRTFFAGADITEFRKPRSGIRLPDVLQVIEQASKPVIAAIHGSALGGGLELAMVCHHRIAVPSATLGLPEVNIGLVPGAGGTQRLPRIIGPQAALEMMTSGAPIRAAEALQCGLLDELVTEGELAEAAVVFARKLVAQSQPLRQVRDRSEKIEAARGHPEIFSDFRQAHAKKFRGFDAPERVIQCVEAAINLPFEEGIALEHKLFVELMRGEQSAAQRHFFFASRQAWNVPGIGKDVPTLPIQSVGILGAGTMGAGIAMNFLNAGIPVTLVETQQPALDRGLHNIRRNYDSSVKKGRLSEADVERRMALLSSSLELSAVAQADLVIEAVFENMEVKKDIFLKLDGIVKPGAILASNTSALDLNDIASVTTRPEYVIGLHFFSPANVMKLLEIVRGAKTSDQVVATAMQLTRKIKKVAVLVGVCPGFVGNRMLFKRQREANQLILEGAMPWAVDRALYDFGFPMGPFAMADLAGLDLGWDKAKSSSSTVREVLCEMDRRGQKNGAGYYDYDDKRKATPSPVVEQVIQDFAAKQGLAIRTVTAEEILQRCIYPMINEGAKILEEGIALRASDIDVVWVNGFGWPVHRGGPMHYADQVGLTKVLATLKDFEQRFGAQFKPAQLLEELVANGRKFGDLDKDRLPR
jgi:3-hydroxyacyl-CoA dehydrogenase